MEIKKLIIPDGYEIGKIVNNEIHLYPSKKPLVISVEDYLGKTNTNRQFGLRNTLGTIYLRDIRKKYRVEGNVYQVENDEQFEKRMGKPLAVLAKENVTLVEKYREDHNGN